MDEDGRRVAVTVERGVVLDEQAQETSGEVTERTGLSLRDIRRNMICCILLDAIFVTGWSDLLMAQQPLLSYLHASNVMIALISGANWTGLFGVFASPWITCRFRYKKWYMLVVHIPYLAAICVAGLGVLFHHSFGMSNHTLLNFILVAFMLHWFFGGFVSLPHQEFVAATIPMSHRGRYSGYSFSIGGACAILSALIGRVILQRYPQPQSFGYLFLLAWGIIQMGYLAALFAKELPTPVEKSPKPWSKKMLKAAWDDKPFLRFLTINIMAVILFQPMFTFLNMFGFNTLHMPKTAAADFQLITQITRIGFSFAAGLIIDRFTPKKVLPYWMLAMGLAILMPAVTNSPLGVYISVALSTIYAVGAFACFNALLYGMPKPQNRAGHYTVQLLLFYAANSVGQLFVGAMCDWLSYRVVFFIWAAIAFLMFPLAKRILSVLSDDIKSYS